MKFSTLILLSSCITLHQCFVYEPMCHEQDPEAACDDIYARIKALEDALLPPSPVTPSPVSPSPYDMKYVVFNGVNCNIEGDFGPACEIYSNQGVLEVMRVSTGFYKIYWNNPYPNNKYIVLTSSNLESTSGAYSSIGGHDNSLGTYFGVSRYFVQIDVRTLSTGAAGNSDYIVVVAEPDFGMQMVVFDGESAECPSNKCNKLMSDGISEIIRTATGQYDIVFDTPYDNSNYLVLTSSNVLGTSMALSGLGGNNIDGNTYMNILNSQVSIQTRIKSTQSTNNYGESDYISFISGFPNGNIRWATFNGKQCTGSGTHGATCSIFDSNGVSEIIRVATGSYTVHWFPFNNNNYVILCDSNLLGIGRTGGAVCGIGGNNDGSHSSHGVSTHFADVQTRAIYSGQNSDSDYIAVVAF